MPLAVLAFLARWKWWLIGAAIVVFLLVFMSFGGSCKAWWLHRSVDKQLERMKAAEARADEAAGQVKLLEEQKAVKEREIAEMTAQMAKLRKMANEAIQRAKARDTELARLRQVAGQLGDRVAQLEAERKAKKPAASGDEAYGELSRRYLP